MTGVTHILYCDTMIGFQDKIYPFARQLLDKQLPPTMRVNNRFLYIYGHIWRRTICTIPVIMIVYFF